MSATKELLLRDSTKSIVPFGCGKHHQFSHSDLVGMGDPSGIAVEEGEFLYGLVRMIHPEYCLETGTNIGVSASYICLALEHNGHGRLDTIEHSSPVAEIAHRKLSGMKFNNFNIVCGMVQAFTPPPNIDFMWLDSTLEQRYNELVTFFPLMSPGGIACIHDLWDLSWDGFGQFPKELKDLLKSGSLRVLTFQTPHGVTVFQKRREKDFVADL